MVDSVTVGSPGAAYRGVQSRPDFRQSAASLTGGKTRDSLLTWALLCP